MFNCQHVPHNIGLSWATSMTFSLNIIQNKESDINLIEAIGDRMFLFKPRRASQIWHCTHAQPKNRQIQRLFFGSRWVMRVMHIRVQNHCFWEIRVSKILSDSQLGPHLYFAQFTNLGSSCFKTGCTKNLFKGCFGRRHKTCFMGHFENAWLRPTSSPLWVF